VAIGRLDGVVAPLMVLALVHALRRPAVAAALATLGAVAAKALLGPRFRITEQRGRVVGWEGRSLVPTVHPSSILRGPPESRDEALAALVADLEVVARLRP